MKLPIGLTVLLILCKLISCTTEDESLFSVGFDPPIVHGIMSTNIFGEYQGYIGNPNVRIYDSRLKTSGEELSTCNLKLFPNPTQSFVNISITGDHGKNREIHVLEARNTLYRINTYYSYFNAVFLYNSGQPVFSTVTDAELITLDVSSFHEGFYRVYLKIGDILLYDNLLVFRQEVY